MPTVRLIKDAVKVMYHLQCGIEHPFKPVLELLLAKRMKAPPTSPETIDRWKFIVSDGKYCIMGVCRDEVLSAQFESKELRKGCKFILEEFRMVVIYPGRVLNRDTSRNYPDKMKICVMLQATPVSLLVPSEAQRSCYMIGLANDVNLFDMSDEVLKPMSPFARNLNR